jgi:hypothetical protein
LARRLVHIKATARTLMRELWKSLRRAPKPCDNHIHRENFCASSAPKCSAISRDTMDCDPSYERMAAKSARVSGPMHLPCTSKLSSTIARAVRSNEPFATRTTDNGQRAHRQIYCILVRAQRAKKLTLDYLT